MLASMFRAIPKGYHRVVSLKQFSSHTGTLADVCNINIVSSPFPPILDSDHYKPIPEFVSADWKNDKLAEKVAIRDGNTGEVRTFSDYNRFM